MTKQQVIDFLNRTLPMENEALKKMIIDHIIETGYKEDYQGWEQLRFIKQEVDQLWGKIKKWSEREIVKERVTQLRNAMPRPTIK